MAKWQGTRRSLAVLCGITALLIGALFVVLGILGLAGVRFARGTVSPDLSPAWRTVTGIFMLGASWALRRMLDR